MDDDTIIPLHFLINRLIGYIEEIDGSNDKYLVVVSSLRNKNIINALNMVWSSIKDKINLGIKIKDYDKFRFNSDIDLPFSTSNHSKLSFKLSKSKYRTSIRGPTLWKNIPTNSEKMQESVTVFKNSVRKRLLELENEIPYF